MAFTWFVHGTPEAYLPPPTLPARHVEAIEEVSDSDPIVPTGGGGQRPPIPGRTFEQIRSAYEQAAGGGHDFEPALHADQIMTSPVTTVSDNMPLEDVWDLIRDRRFRHVPVISRDRQLVGIVSDRDLLRNVGLLSTEEGRRTPVRELMTGKVLTALPSAPIRDIARVLLENRIGAMPIVDSDGDLVGILTRTDILRAVMNHPELDLWI
jgi:acetoin utilization protein AcuB